MASARAVREDAPPTKEIAVVYPGKVTPVDGVYRCSCTECWPAQRMIKRCV